MREFARAGFDAGHAGADSPGELSALLDAAAYDLAFHRFAEVSIGIAVALLLAVVWPEREATQSG